MLLRRLTVIVCMLALLGTSGRLALQEKDREEDGETEVERVEHKCSTRVRHRHAVAEPASERPIVYASRVLVPHALAQPPERAPRPKPLRLQL